MDKLVSNVEAALVAFVPLAVAQSMLEAALLAAASGLADKDKDSV